jgi:3-hydroxy-9,10-secoandrosta-1,3,5(10)-triene-9,17-dione monooxygenase
MSSMTPDALVARASAMVPRLRKRAAEAEAQRNIPAATVRDFLDAGFYRVIQPRKFGGLEFDIETMARMAMEIARGCPSSAWVLCLTAGHTMLLAQYPAVVQAAAFGKDGDFRAPYQAHAMGTAIPVDGGYRVTGGWDYASGADHSNWGAVNCRVVQPEGAPVRIVTVLVPMSKFTIVDNWQSLGMRATGSKRIELHEVFVEELWAPSAVDLMRVTLGTSPGASVHKNPMYRSPFQPFFMAEIASVAVGMGKGAIEAFDEVIRGKTRKYPPRIRAVEDVAIRREFAEAVSLIDVAEAALLAGARRVREETEAHVASGQRFTDEEEFRLMLILQQAIRLVAQAIDLVFVAGGTSSTVGDGALPRLYRDIGMVRTHALGNLDWKGDQWAAAHFGVPPYYPV